MVCRVIAHLSAWTHSRTQSRKCFAQKYAIRDTCRETETQCFQRLKKTDNVLIKEKHSLCWWETAGVLPISRWIYIISEICCWRSFFNLFIYFLVHFIIIFYFFHRSSEAKLALDWQASLSVRQQRKTFLWQRVSSCHQTTRSVCRKKIK